MNWKLGYIKFREKVADILARLGLVLPGKVMYIGGSDTLPPPLKREEEAALIARLEAGDPRARDLLIEHNLRLVAYIARRFENTGVHIEDLISIGTIGLIKAVGTYQPPRPSSWPPTPAGASRTRSSCTCARRPTRRPSCPSTSR